MLKLGRILREWLLKRLGWRVYYVGGSEGLPPPLSRAETEECLDRLRRADASVKPVLIERNLRLVVYIAKRFESSGIGIEDLISIGAIGLIKAVNTFDPDKNIKLATYASRCIAKEILMYLRKASRIRAEVSLDEPLNVDRYGNELLLSDILGTDDDLVSRNIEEEIDREEDGKPHLLSKNYHLAKEYYRDVEKGIDIQMPFNYFPDNNVNRKPVMTWRSHGSLLYANWLNYYLYQQTPYDLEDLKKMYDQ